MDYQKKYIKYRKKYENLKIELQKGGVEFEEIKEDDVKKTSTWSDWLGLSSASPSEKKQKENKPPPLKLKKKKPIEKPIEKTNEKPMFYFKDGKQQISEEGVKKLYKINKEKKQEVVKEKESKKEESKDVEVEKEEKSSESEDGLFSGILNLFSSPTDPNDFVMSKELKKKSEEIEKLENYLKETEKSCNKELKNYEEYKNLLINEFKAEKNRKIFEFKSQKGDMEEKEKGFFDFSLFEDSSTPEGFELDKILKSKKENVSKIESSIEEYLKSCNKKNKKAKENIKLLKEKFKADKAIEIQNFKSNKNK